MGGIPESEKQMQQDTVLTSIPRWRLSGVVIGAAIALFCWGLLCLGILNPVDGALYDAFLRLCARTRPVDARVMLVVCEDSTSADETNTCRGLMDILRQKGASRIVFNFLPHSEEPSFYESAISKEDVSFGRAVVESVETSSEITLGPLPVDTEGLTDRLGVVWAAPPEGGIYRRQLTHLNLDGTLVPTLEWIVAGRRETGDEPVTGASYRVFFRGGAGSLPTLSANRVLQGELVRDLVDGMTVLIGRNETGPLHMMRTPGVDRNTKMSYLEYQGHALNTLIADRQIHDLNAVLTLALLTVIIAGSAMLQQSLGPRLSLILTFLFIAVCSVGTYVVLLFFHVWIHTGAFVLAWILLFLAIGQRKLLLVGEAAEKLTYNLAAFNRGLYSPEENKEEVDSWHRFTGFITHMLDIGSLVFLERKGDKFHLEEIVALHCSLRDIKERRRDFRRTPYTDAMKTRGPIRVRNYLVSQDTKECQYLLSIQSGGQLFGFCAFSILEEDVQDIVDFEGLLANYSEEMGRLVNEQRELERLQKRTGLLRRITASERFQTVLDSLKGEILPMHARLQKIEFLMQRIHVSFIIYDLFGRLHLANRPMVDTLTTRGLKPFNMSALDLIVSLTETSLSDARSVLRSVVMRRETHTMTVQFGSARSFNLLVGPLESPGTDDSGGGTAFGLLGILFELTDTTELDRYFEMKAFLSEALGKRFRNDLTSIKLAAQLLAGVDIGPEERAGMLDIINGKIADSVTFLRNARDYLATDAGRMWDERFPVDAVLILESAIADLKAETDAKNVSVTVEKPAVSRLVYASRNGLKSVLSALLEFLLTDAMRDSAIHLALSEGPTKMTLHVSNRGYGMPNDTLQDYLSSKDSLASESMESLGEAIRLCEQWGGSLSMTSEVSVGTTAELNLDCFS